MAREDHNLPEAEVISQLTARNIDILCVTLSGVQVDSDPKRDLVRRYECSTD